jgi:hypothetical protein
MTNSLKLISILFVMSTVGMSTVNAQRPTEEIAEIYRFGNAERALVISVPSTSCDPLTMDAQGCRGFYFPKPILGGSIDFQVVRTANCWTRPMGDISFKIKDDTKLIVKGRNGLVGVNTTDPKRQLDVNGDIAAKNLFIDNIVSVPWSYACQINVNRDDTKAFVVEKNNNTVFSILGNGVVNAKKIYAEAFEVTPNAMTITWYDHVFAQDYKLRSLSELETFIKQNNHLPEIPSAKEVEENGINLGEMQAKLLLKVEELTLYIIALEKQVKELQQKVNEKGGE